jgi:ABC-2 type transport system permease protein
MMFGGRFAPLEALPPILHVLANAMPFKWMFAYPAELLMGKVTSPGEAFLGIGAQLAWLAGIAVAFRIGWAAAIKRYTAVSG